MDFEPAAVNADNYFEDLFDDIVKSLKEKDRSEDEALIAV